MAIVLNGTTGITAPDIDVTAQASDITTTGDITAVDATLSGGVYLGGTGAANKLDDYEEGTWTPDFGGTRAVSSGNTNYTYTKVGRLVTVHLYHVNVTWTGTTSAISISGLPFSAASLIRSTGAVNTRNVNFNDSMVNFCVSTESNSDILFFPQQRDDATWVSLGMSDLTQGDYLNFSITYETDS